MNIDSIDSIVLDSLSELINLIPNGATLALPADYGGSPGEAAREIIRQGKTHLKIIGGPPTGYVSDLLIGAGVVDTIECPGIILGDFGLAPRFRAAITAGTLKVIDTTCPAFHASIAAAQKGLPFMPIRGLLGSDVLKVHREWRIINNPFDLDTGVDPIVLIPAYQPEFLLFHARYGDRYGNVWIGKNFEVKAMAQAAKNVLVTFEKLYDGNLLEDSKLAPSTIASFYLRATTQVEHGTYPIFLGNEHSTDVEHMTMYAQSAKTSKDFRNYLNQYVFKG
ncbi:MAG: CoA synthetase [Burkholderiaceae bacterium]|nr:CoA synthetase [Burkholderiaceae bacterium]